MSNNSSDVTVVSCYYIIRSKFPKKQYLEWIKNYIFLNFHSVIFCDELTKKFLIDNIPTIINSKTILKILDISNFKTSEYKDWKKDLKKDDEIKKGVNHSVKLYKIWNEKIYFLNKVINENPFESNFFLWNDIGSFRTTNKNKLQLIKELQFPQSNRFVKGKVSMFKIKDFTLDEKKNINNIDSRFKHVNRYGGMFGGDKESLIIFEKKYTKLLHKFKKKNIFAGKDQSIYNFLVLQNPNLIHTINSHKVNKSYDKWFCFHFYFSNYKL